jgi:WD40 repeat protein/uncharacterized caspase-like protein
LFFLTSGVCSAQKPELVVQTGHSGWIFSVAFSPDGKLLASGSSDQTIKLWDVATGTELRSLRGHTYNVESIAFSRDGKLLVSLSGGNEIKVWNALEGSLRQTLKPADFVNSIAISPDGHTIAGGDNQGRIKLWNILDGREPRTFEGQAPRINSVAFSADGRFLVGGGDESTISLWDVKTGAVLHTIKDRSYGVNTVAFSPDGQTVATGSFGEVRLWDPNTGLEIRTFREHASHISAVAFSSDGKTLASANYLGTIKLWDVDTGAELRTLAGHASEIRSVAFSPDGKSLASGATDQTIRFWDTTSGSELRKLTGHSTAAFSVAFSRDGKTILAGSIDNTVKLWDLTTGELRTLAGHSAEILSLAFSPNGRILASGSADDSIKLWDVSNGAKLHDLAWDSTVVGSVAFSPDGKVIAGGSDDHKIKLWNVSTGAELHALKGHDNSVNAVAFSPDGKILATGSYKEVKLWNTETGNELRILPGHSNNVNTLRFSPDGKVLASDSSFELYLWDVTTGKKLHTFRAGNNKICTFSPDSKRIFSGALYSDIVEWDVGTGVELHRFKGHTFAPLSVSFSPDSKIMASGSVDNTIKLWDVGTATELRTLSGHSGPVETVSFSSDGRILISGSDDRMIKLWDPANGDELLTQVVLDDQDEQDWAVIAPDGLFDGSSPAWRRIIWRFTGVAYDFVPIEVFFNEFFYPELLPDIMAGKRPKATQNISQKDRRQPKVKMVLASARTPSDASMAAQREIGIRLSVSEDAANKEYKSGSGARDVRLFRNGSLVKVWRGDAFRLGAKDGCKQESRGKVVCEATVPVVAGENRLIAYAFNRDGIKSGDAGLTLTGADSLRRASTLYVLAVGVGQYANSHYNLNYAAKDAKAFAAEVRSQQKKLTRFERVEVIELLDQAGKKTNILAELKKLAGKVQPEDVVVVYFSGHGAAEKDRFYLIPHDIGYLGSRRDLDPDGLQTILIHSISDLELEEAFRHIDAAQLLLVIDACNSGQALESEEKRRGPMNSKGLAQLAYEKGMYILTASQSYEVAFESETLKHSYLAYALVEGGLKTAAADKEPTDGEVTLREWLGYATREVPRLRRERVERAAKKELVEAGPGEQQKVQQPRLFYRREPDAWPLVVAKPGLK